MTTCNTDAYRILEALASRLEAIAPALLEHELPAESRGGENEPGELLDVLVRAVHARPTSSRLWLLLVAVSATYPTTAQLVQARREFELRDPIDSAAWLLQACLDAGATVDSMLRPLELVTNGVIVDVNHSARDNHHTGIQQVVRQTVPHWARDHDVHLAAWTEADEALRNLTDTEYQRVINWHGRPDGAGVRSPSSSGDIAIIAPWRCLVVLPEIATESSALRLAELAASSGSRVVAIGYDMIPVISAHLLPVGAAMRTALYLGVVKRAARIAAISASAATEFAGFRDMLPEQGLPEPVVIECELPTKTSSEPVSYIHSDGRPLVLCVGSLEPRKNHLALLHAAESLWRQGHDFELVLVGGSVWGDDLRRRIDELQSIGRPLVVALRIPESDLIDYYAKARFSVLPSLHEGFGLPVVESFAAGVPVITTDFGSTAQIGARGGALLIDPRDDESLVEAMRSLLTDDDQLMQLRQQIVSRKPRTWKTYADELWSELVVPELQARP